jgi:tetratricopeptide (TPR) repeat protein
VARLANALRYELVKAEAERRATQSPNAIDFAMRGWALMQAAPRPTKVNCDAARALFDQALKIDPNNSDTLAGDAATYVWDYLLWRDSETNYDAQVINQADRSIALDQGNIRAYQAKSFYLTNSSRPKEALRVIDAGLAINPNAAFLYATRSITETYLGQFEQAKSDVQQAMRLSPRDPAFSQWHNFMADAEIGLGNFDTAIDACNKAIDGGYRVFYSYLNLAVACAFKGSMDEAHAALAEALRLNPDLSIKWLVEHKPVLQPSFDHLRTVGLPER